MIVILGAGINGCALARELLLGGMSVTLVDTADAAFGATAYASRLIHGGLRYLEYGEFDLVRESLAERRRLLRLAPQFVRPLELGIPLERLGGGLLSAVARFAGGSRIAPAAFSRGAQKKQSGSRPSQRGKRGLLLTWAGLALYDAYAKDPALGRHHIERIRSGRTPINAERFHWLAVYHDVQILSPERFTLALLEDARRIASENHREFRFLNYHRAHLTGATVKIEPTTPQFALLKTTVEKSGVVELKPAALVNATGAWVDRTWRGVGANAPRLMGPTKGSHCFLFHAGLRAALAGRGIYAEAADGRPIFITPLGDAVLLGTTDEPFADDPATAVARKDETRYLLDAANAIFPALNLRPEDVAFTYCGVRPLPLVDASSPGAITRRHAIRRDDFGPAPCYSIIGGKLTTCRSLAEEAATRILTDLGRPPTANSRDPALPGGENYPGNPTMLARERNILATRHRLPPAVVEAVWNLFGTRSDAVLGESLAAGRKDHAEAPADVALVPGTSLTECVVRWIIDHEWVVTLDDLVERRLMLLFERRLTRQTLIRLAELLVEQHRLANADATSAVEATVRRLAEHFGRRLRGD